ncbi:MAG: hypothetical protein LQ350_001177 [Teloschistes chrysophthalmus]|nr:MAG: hypothetical protein LQ350_001177 [Niorma chrysophthalma]
MSPSPSPHSPPHASRDQAVQPSVPAKPKTDPVEMKRIPLEPKTFELKVSADIEIASKDQLRAKIATLETRIDDTRVKLDHATAKLKHPDPNQTVNHHIKLLRQYNDVRDIATGLMGIMAEHRQLPMKRIYQDLGLDEKD